MAIAASVCVCVCEIEQLIHYSQHSFRLAFFFLVQIVNGAQNNWNTGSNSSDIIIYAISTRSSVRDVSDRFHRVLSACSVTVVDPNLSFTCTARELLDIITHPKNGTYVVVLTYEKMFLLVCAAYEKKLLDNFKLFMVDELHNMGHPKCGAWIIGALTLLSCNNRETRMRFIGLSSSFPNADEYFGPGKWVEAQRGHFRTRYSHARTHSESAVHLSLHSDSINEMFLRFICCGAIENVRYDLSELLGCLPFRTKDPLQPLLDLQLVSLVIEDTMSVIDPLNITSSSILRAAYMSGADSLWSIICASLELESEMSSFNMSSTFNAIYHITPLHFSRTVEPPSINFSTLPSEIKTVIESHFGFSAHHFVNEFALPSNQCVQWSLSKAVRLHRVAFAIVLHDLLLKSERTQDVVDRYEMRIEDLEGEYNFNCSV